MPEHSIDIGVLQIEYVSTEHPEARLDRVLGLLHEHGDADVLVLPELWAHGAFSPEHWSEEAVTLDDDLLATLAATARQLEVVLHAGSFIERAEPGADHGPQGRGLWNTSIVFDSKGQVAARYRKIHRFGFGDGEPLHLEAGAERVTMPLSRGGDSTVIGLATCYDLRFPELFRAHLDDNVEIFLVPASWPAPRREHWRVLGRARALENQAYVVQANICGAHGGLDMAGHSQVVAPDGEVIASAGEESTVLRATLDLDGLRRFRHDFPVLADRREPKAGQWVDRGRADLH